MGKGPQIPKRDAERALRVLEYSRKSEPKYKRPNAFGAWLTLLIGLAVAGLIVYYVLHHKEQFASLWQKATHPPAAASQVQTDQ
ncbi:MAG TPA: hypothetical protein VMH22_12285 [bacterium]|nr:hypothetical protein [bacterium]